MMKRVKLCGNLEAGPCAREPMSTCQTSNPDTLECLLDTLQCFLDALLQIRKKPNRVSFSASSDEQYILFSYSTLHVIHILKNRA
jgi:hypothetical protein